MKKLNWISISEAIFTAIIAAVSPKLLTTLRNMDTTIILLLLSIGVFIVTYLIISYFKDQKAERKAYNKYMSDIIIAINNHADCLKVFEDIQNSRFNSGGKSALFKRPITPEKIDLDEFNRDIK